jgi:hypothetical protein
MNRCPNCAAQNREGAKFCTSCGFRLPVTSVPPMTSDRSPFATTSTVPSHSDQVPEEPKPAETAEESGFATWSMATAPEPEVEETPGRSWDAPPPQNTAVPVNEDMIASLIGEADTVGADDAAAEAGVVEAEPTPMANEHPTWVQAAPVPAPSPAGESNPSIDQLLKLARELEYGLMELAEVSAPAGSAPGDARLLTNALADLQDEDDLASLRTAVSNAQERPRDVDVMLDLVLRADAIAQVLTERDQLKSAIELSLGNPPQPASAETIGLSELKSDEPVAEIPAKTPETDEEQVSENVDASHDDAESVTI